MGTFYSILLINLLLNEKIEAELLIPLFDSRIVFVKDFILERKSGNRLVLLKWASI